MNSKKQPKTITTRIPSPVRAAFKGIYKWEVIQNNSVVSKGQADNLVLDSFLNAISPVNGDILSSNLGNVLTTLRVGTGTILPSVSDTTLVNEISNTATKLVTNGKAELNVLDNSQLIESISAQFQFDLGAIDTSISGTIRELGVSSVGSNLLSRVVITPGIEVESDQQLRITYELQALISITDRQPLSLTIPGLGNFTGTLPNAGKGLFNYSLYDNTSSVFDNLKFLTSPTRLSIIPTTTPLGSFASVGADMNEINFTGSSGATENGNSYAFLLGTAQPYTNGTFVQRVDFRFTSNNAWTTPAGGFVLRNAFMFKFDAGQSFTKDDQTILDLIFTASWGRL